MSIPKKSIGKSPSRIDATKKVTGSTQFAADQSQPGLLHIKVLRSPYAHALIKSIDYSTAESMSGVVAVITGENLPGPFGGAVCDEYPLAREKVRFAGEPVAAVIAISSKLAAKALSGIQVEYEELPFVLDPFEAMSSEAPVIHEGMESFECAPFVTHEKNNIYHHFKVRKGEAETAMEKADCVVEGEFYFPASVHSQLEPHCATAIYHLDNSMEMVATTQAPFIIQGVINELYDIPYHHIKVTSPMLGGGFGGKSDVTIEALVACAARRVPEHHVRLNLTREEMFSGSPHGRNVKMHYKLGFSDDGHLLAIVGKVAQGSGGYADDAVNIITGMGLSGTGPYSVADLKLDLYGVYTNTPPIGAMRGYGHSEVHLAVESLMDEAAATLDIPPLELRQKNLLKPGDKNGVGQVMTEHSGNVKECASIIGEELYAQPLPRVAPHHKVGRGIACYMKAPCMPSNAQSSAFIKLNADGTVVLSTGAVDMGQGMHTALSQIAAEALGISFEHVSFQDIVDTATSPYDWQTVASRQTWGVGNAILLAAEDLKRKLQLEGARLFNVAPEDIKVDEGIVSCNDNHVAWGTFITGHTRADGKAVTKPVMGEGHFVPTHIQNPDKETGQGEGAADWTFGCVGVELAVDTETGVITLLRLLNAIDAGTIINPVNATEQVKGGMLLALGSTLSEKVVYDESSGAMRTKNFTDYKIPGIEDLPLDTSVFFVETPEDTGPYGAKGLGEHGAVSTAPAILNALCDAIGVRINELPASPERVLEALKGGVRNDHL